jgi:hypothetical protein
VPSLLSNNLSGGKVNAISVARGAACMYKLGYKGLTEVSVDDISADNSACDGHPDDLCGSSGRGCDAD